MFFARTMLATNLDKIFLGGTTTTGWENQYWVVSLYFNSFETAQPGNRIADPDTKRPKCLGLPLLVRGPSLDVRI